MASMRLVSSPPSDEAGIDDTYRKVYDRVADAIVIHDKATHRILDVNAAALKRYGYTLEEMRERTPFDLHPPEELDLVAEKINTRNVSAPNHYVHVSKDGRRYDVEILSDDVMYKGIPAWLSIVRDITDRKRAAEQLAHARDEAIVASKHKSDFVAAVSHELRTPMNGVIGMAEMMLESDLQPDQREFVATIHRAGLGMIELLNELLDQSKIEAGRLQIELIPFDLAECVGDAYKLLLPRAEEAGIELRLHFAPETRQPLVGDPVRIRQIVINLASNAIKFTRQGYVAVKAECLHAGPAHLTVRITVEDTGIGIDADKLEKIFDEFTQADRSTYRQFGGTGLGLSISRRLVELMGGEIHVTSEPDRGSTFWFDLQLPREIEADDRSLFGSSGVGVLLVDGDPQRRQDLAEHVAGWGLQAKTVGSGAEALEFLRGEASRDFRVALLHFELPDIDGETLGRALRLDLDPQDLDLMLVAPPDLSTSRRWQAAGFSHRLDAPVVEERLHERLSPHLPAKENPMAPSSASTRPAAEVRPSVLVVEDNAVNQKVVSHMLKKLGCETEIAEHGEEALRMLAQRAYDVILMDCQMPRMDGYEATRRIRGLPERRSIPIVALTANAMPGDREKCIDAGMNDYVSKPATTDQLAAVLERWVGVRA